ncbi:N-acetyl-D-glucosamine kinase [Leucobacter aridicollis]|uniref:ROK family transcriptional regulator n=1 Tax=Leucobacter aridicollis TaxID=283878 RepID=UPI000EB1F2EE|nr:ROK family protein [Leucobacter aridicollis]MCS3426937.1 putative NBD/HSP70 family sugar kinase [Leucobacter aridicollis]RKQ85378.1 putative NBD/HSP70 family sugar kinase [Mycolicibacterium mucogenicum 261Sha1.1M5]
MAKTNPPSIAARVALQLRDGGPDSVNGIAAGLELSRTSVENVLGALTTSGAVTRTTVTGAGVGRPSRLYAFDAAAGYVAGVDVGNASTRVVISDLSGAVIADHAGRGVGEFADGAAKLACVTGEVTAAFAAASLPLDALRAVGLSLPGIVNEAGLVLTSVVIPEWSGADIGGHLREALGAPVSVDNGVRLAAVAEHHLGAAQLVNDVLYVSVGNRIAMGLIVDGRPRRGAHNAAGDIGRLAFSGVDPVTGQIEWQSAGGAAEVFERARSGDDSAIAELHAFVEGFARSLATLILAIDPGKVVIGGGLSRAHEEFLLPLSAAVARHIRLPFEFPLVAARLGGEAAAHGALVHAFRRSAFEIYGIEEMGVPRITPVRN